MRIHWSRFVILLLGMLAITACGSHTAASASFSSAVVTQATHTGTHRPDRPSVSPSDSTQRPRTTPLTLTVTPSMGPANSLVTLQLTSPKPPPGSVANICWGGCGASSYTTGVRFHRVGSHLYTGTTRLPGGWMALPGGFARVLKKGVYSLSVTCLTSQPACAYHPEASTTFRLTHRAVVAAWSQLPRGTWHAVPTLEALPLASGVTATDANSPGRRVTCHPAPLQAGQPSSAALIVTGPDPFRAPLSAQVFGSVSGEVACRAVALDPHDVNTIYAAGAIDPGSNGPLAFPPPVYSTDRGHKWQRVPTPAGLSSRRFCGLYGISARRHRMVFASRHPLGLEPCRPDYGRNDRGWGAALAPGVTGMSCDRTVCMAGEHVSNGLPRPRTVLARRVVPVQ